MNRGFKQLEIYAKGGHSRVTSLLVAFAQVLILTACSNIQGLNSAISPAASPFPTPSPGATYVISSVTLTDGSGSSGSSGPMMNVYFNTAQSAGSLLTVCSGSTSATNPRPCTCQVDWEEQNQTSGSTVLIPRQVFAVVETVQTGMAACRLPPSFSNGPNQEVFAGTQLKISIIPGAVNSNEFTVTPFNYRFRATTTQGDFQDVQGNSFNNVYRYTCYDTRKKQPQLQSFSRLVSDPAGTDPTPRPEAYATIFCANGAAAGSNCKPIVASERSSQSYYYNFYIRSSDKGAVEASNGSMVCPRVQEPTIVPQVGGDFFPMDTTFALAVNPSSLFTVGIEAFTKLRVSGGSSTTDQGCVSTTVTDGSDPTTDEEGSGTSTASTSAKVKSCLGYAARPNSDTSCPYFRRADGTLRPTYRLRRFAVLYPPVYDSTGKMKELKTDMTYIVDRPVYSPSADPLKPYMMLGPKPCPFAYFDASGVLGDPLDTSYPGGMPSYAATSYAGWNGTNIDGVEFPNKDIGGTTCSTTLPLLNQSQSIWSLGTLNTRNPTLKRLFVRPVEAWAPHYVEDTSFEACAPLSEPFIEAPLHFAKDPSSGNVGWCAEVYPTQNPAIAQLDRLAPPAFTGYPGRVVPYTSHVVKNAAGPSCAPTIPNLSTLTSTYPPDPSSGAGSCKPSTQALVGTAWHPNNLLIDTVAPIGTVCGNGSTKEGGSCYFCADKSCDRTATIPLGAWGKFPLLARPSQVESALSTDSTFGCIVSWDAGGGKSGKNSPSQGCCGTSVQVWTGIPTGSGNPFLDNTAAHLEPGQQCLTPNY